MSGLPAGVDLMDNLDLVSSLRSELRDLAAERSATLAKFSPVVRKRVEALQIIQEEHEELEKKYFEERAALEAKYQKLYEPLYAKRYEIVNGIKEDEVTEATEAGSELEEDKAAEEKGIPDFWLTALKHHEAVTTEIFENDEGALKYLNDIKWARINDPKGFKLEFYFDSNPYFTNPVLSKTYYMIEEDEPILEKAIGTEIEWHSGNCLTQKIHKRKPKKKSKTAKPTNKIIKCASFFNFFNPPSVPEENEEIDDHAAEELKNFMERDYDVGCAIRDKIIPDAVSWFTGEAADTFDCDGNDD